VSECFMCGDEPAFTVRIADINAPRERMGVCERHAVVCDDAKLIKVGSAIRLFPKEVKR